MGEAGRRGTKDLAVEGVAMRPGRGLVFGVGGFDRRPDPTCQTDLCRQTLLMSPMPYSTIQKGNGGALARVRVRTLSRGRKEGRLCGAQGLPVANARSKAERERARERARDACAHRGGTLLLPSSPVERDRERDVKFPSNFG